MRDWRLLVVSLLCYNEMRILNRGVVMVEFISLLISYMFMSFADNIDIAFTNMISIDSVVVCGSIGSLALLLKAFGRFGSYTYRVIRKNESQCLQLDLLSSIVVMLVIYFTRPFIVNVYDLTTAQKDLLYNVLTVYAVYVPFYTVDNGLFEQVRLSGRLKLYRWSLICLYFFLIGFDCIAYFVYKSMILIFASSMLASFISIVQMIVCMKMKFIRLDRETLSACKKYGVSIAVERFVGGLGIALYSVICSRLSTELYAIHSVCFSALSTTECVTNAYQAALMIKLPIKKEFDIVKKASILWAKRLLSFIMLLFLTHISIALLISHGSVDIKSCFPWVFAYMINGLALWYYESCKSLIIVTGNTDSMPIATAIGIILRVMVCFAGLYTGIPLILFGLAYGVDYAVRGYFFIRPVLKKQRYQSHNYFYKDLVMDNSSDFML